LLLIEPSSEVAKSVMSRQHELYRVLCNLRPLIEDFEEKPFFNGVPLGLERVVFPCRLLKSGEEDCTFRLLPASRVCALGIADIDLSKTSHFSLSEGRFPIFADRHPDG
jgi:hypothetical protein